MSERVLSVAEARALDRDAVERLGMPSILLMENAARSVAEIARSLGERYVVLCGPGNNGGDGLAAARHLGRSCRIHLLAEPDPHKSPDAALQLRILRAAGYSMEIGAAPAHAPEQDEVVIDALFGTGLERPLTGAALALVQWTQRARGPILAVDIPSGLHGDRGVVLGDAVRAAVTVTFVAKKRGMLIGDGPQCCGRVVVAGLGLP